MQEKLQDACEENQEMIMNRRRNQAADFVCRNNWEDEVVKETMKHCREKKLIDEVLRNKYQHSRGILIKITFGF